MPIIKYNGKICHFAHIPKCGGSSVEDYFIEIGAQTHFLGRDFDDIQVHNRWNITSPQHIDGASLRRLFSPAFFDFGFTVVRHPISRFISAFRYQTEWEKRIDTNTNINDFIQNDLQDCVKHLGHYEHHFRKQLSFLIPDMNYSIFKLENGLGPVKKFIDEQFNNKDTNCTMAHSNKSRESKLDLTLNEKSKHLLREIYAQDFEKLRYE